MPTKQEGPAQERECIRCDWKGSQSDTVHPKHWPDDKLCPECYEVTEAVPATPAPSQPAGAREWLQDKGVGVVYRHIYGGERVEYSPVDIAALLTAYAAQQTAAKDAALKQTQADLIKFGQHGPYCPQGAKCNCGYNDALWRFDGAPTNWRDRAVAAERERDSLREQLRTAEEAFDRMATCEDDESEEYVTAWDALGAALKAGKE